MRISTGVSISVMALAMLAVPALAAERHVLTADDVMSLTGVRELTCTADGRSAAWVATTNDMNADKRRPRIWLADLQGGTPRAITAPEAGAGAPAFSPDGRSIAFTATRDKDEHDQIWLLDLRGGEAEKLTDVEGDITLFEWSPDGRQIVIAMSDPAPKPPKDDPKRPLPQVMDDVLFKQDTQGFITGADHAHLWLFDVASRKLTRLTPSGPWDESEMAWSPDGRAIAFLADHHTDPAAANTQWLEVIGTQPGAKSRVVARFGAAPGQKLVWSADGHQIVHAVGVTAPEAAEYSQPQLAQTDLASGATHILPSSAGLMIETPVALGKGRIGGILVEDRHTVAVTIDPAGGPLVRLGDPAKSVAAQCGATDGGNAPRAIIASGDGDPSEVRVMAGATLTKLSTHNSAIAATVAWNPAEDFSATASDGNDVHALLIKPAGYQPGHRYPTVVWIHGGPQELDRHSLEPAGNAMMQQWLAAHGYAVIAVNYRGSTGRGTDYSATIAGDWGNKEVKDLDAAIDHVIKAGVADPDRLGVGGWSYGGILTDFMIVREPRFKVAMSGAGEGNIFALFGVDEYIGQYWHEIGLPWQNFDRWVKISEPLLHADRIRTPTLFMGGTSDDNVPLVGGQQMYEALRILGVPTQLVAYPGAFHGVTRPSFVRDRLDRMAAWYGKYLPAKVAH
ncbi:S9 family peptidase [Novosphingobium sp.]|uniref:S9 family peptidase n=1 Tax=Novosphingobium sp. TaxID=1874826 RepID=UPI003B525029